MPESGDTQLGEAMIHPLHVSWKQLGQLMNLPSINIIDERSRSVHELLTHLFICATIPVQILLLVRIEVKGADPDGA